MVPLWVRIGLAPGVGGPAGRWPPAEMLVRSWVCGGCWKAGCTVGLCGGEANTTEGSQKRLVGERGLFGVSGNITVIATKCPKAFSKW